MWCSPPSLFLLLLHIFLSASSALAAPSPAPQADGTAGTDNSSTTPTSSAPDASATSASFTGDSFCNTFMCVAAFANGSSTTYVLQSTGSLRLGWMAVGFGAQMANTPLVILWPNSDGSITLSQRSATGYVMPTVQNDPPRLATLHSDLSDLSGSQPKLVFSVPIDPGADATQPTVWAYSLQNPASSSPSATILAHLAASREILDLSQSISSEVALNPISATNPTGGSGNGDGSNGGNSGQGGDSGDTSTDSGTNSGSGVSLNPPLLPYQRLIAAHGIILTIAFLFLLPLGALIGRWLRTNTPAWFRAHWIIQAGLTGPIVLVGLILGVESVNRSGGVHLDSPHKRWGVAITVVYVVQLALGALIHFVKPDTEVSSKYSKRRRNLAQLAVAPFVRPGRRPFQNYFHAVLGLAIIAVAFYQVRTGYETEWVSATGRLPLPTSVSIVWFLWVVLLPLLYSLGLFLLPKQWRQERQARMNAFVASNQRDHMRSNSGARLLAADSSSPGMREADAAGTVVPVSRSGRRHGDRDRQRGVDTAATTVRPTPTLDRHHSHRSHRERSDRDRERDRERVRERVRGTRAVAGQSEYPTRRPSHRRHHSSRDEYVRGVDRDRERERERERRRRDRERERERERRT